jgi:hypothetical protein
MTRRVRSSHGDVDDDDRARTNATTTQATTPANEAWLGSLQLEL